ncbi:hypothetical protein PF005_g15915 [Phytophthora fragariae]|uniref:Uncharacterized protein n=1 Tax=Phytophthora fragariae TaxID=53985 RepID=A0A6A3XA21_9STRA|nr:hypothetical protein PF003_g33603 [Phytophthora fragariae]KAE8931664.1 hypothetical protein PF009_g18289 [Phytophthora fragariae]KAE9002263.1 hypothetical protein PF011_g13394 [Phytophthora fragariae]KAE9088808.1 hypothetical protein PF007_g19836 [Phytophthora fragariae]KAE9132885.1 hypothetical protein PF010_g3019 [Phytophthora fragariae]
MTKNSLLASALCTVIGLHGGIPAELLRVESTLACFGRKTICFRRKMGGAFPSRRIMLMILRSRALISAGAAIHSSWPTPPYPGATCLCRCRSIYSCMATS